MVQNRPGEYEKKSKEDAVAEKCGRSNGAEEWVRLKKRSVAACYTTAAPHTGWNCQQSFRRLMVLLIGLSICKERIAKSVCSGWRRLARDIPREGRKPRVCSACMHTVPPYTAIILSPELNCGFTSDRPFACFFQKTDVIRNSYRREGFCTDSQHCGIRTKLFRIGSRRLKVGRRTRRKC
jgi:hypothetical protein